MDLNSSLTPEQEQAVQAAWAEFDALILERIKAAEKPGGISTKSVDDILQNALQKYQETRS
ncbi:MAG: hypothetical protein MK076_02120 [Flavobacteriales bacterium]|nr:hypothetical protein [Flavobacteriales bacterium]